MTEHLSKTQATWLLAAVIIARSTSFLFSKILLLSLPLFCVLTMRFLLAFLLLLVLFHRRLSGLNWDAAWRGSILGVCFTGVLFCELLCLKSCDTSTTSFLENSAIVIVPFLNMAVTRRAPHRKTLLGCLCAFAGVALLTLSCAAQRPGFGFVFGLLAAFLYAVAILLTGIFSQKTTPF